MCGLSSKSRRVTIQRQRTVSVPQPPHSRPSMNSCLAQSCDAPSPPAYSHGTTGPFQKSRSPKYPSIIGGRSKTQWKLSWHG
jgi:hypothetical protein